MFITAGTSEGIELALTALLDRDGEVLVPMPTYPLYTAIIAKIGARALYYRTDPSQRLGPGPRSPRDARDAERRARSSIIDPNNPTGASYPTPVRRALLEFADRHGLAILADEVYGDLGYDGPVAPLGSFDHDAPVISFSSLSKAYLAPGWRTGWMSIGKTPRLDEVAAAVRKLADGRLCSTVPMQYAVTAALTGDKSHQVSFRAALKERATHHRRQPARDARRVLHDADGRLLRDAEGSRCRPEKPTKTTCSACCARPACCASTDRDSGCRRRTAICASSSSRRPTS